MAVKMKVTYLDGRVEEVLASPRAQFMAEERFNGITDANRIRAGYFLAWASLHKAGKESADFETFLDQVMDVDDMSEQMTADDVDPTHEEAPPTSSASSL